MQEQLSFVRSDEHVRVEIVLYEETGKRSLFEQQLKHQNHNGLKKYTTKT